MSENRIDPEKLKELRHRTSVGLGKCKEALEQAQGNLDEAIDLLRKWGIASAVKKEGREVKEGTIVALEDADTVALVEVNAETDFVVSNQSFKDFAHGLAQLVLRTKPSSLESFLKQPFDKDSELTPELTVNEGRAVIMQSLGENIKISRILSLPKSASHSFGIYSHMGGKIVALVELEGGVGHDEVARAIAMHVAAECPEYLTPEEIPQDVKSREEDIIKTQSMGKNPSFIDKIVEGKMRTFYEKVCLVLQKFVRDPSVTIAQFLDSEGKRAGKSLAIRRFIRWKVGE